MIEKAPTITNMHTASEIAAEVPAAWTMEVCPRLIGETMAEPSVDTLVAMNSRENWGRRSTAKRPQGRRMCSRGQI